MTDTRPPPAGGEPPEQADSTAATAQRLTAAIAAAWQAIRDRHPEVPPVLPTIASGTVGQRGATRLGHFAAHRWASAGGELHELFVGGEGLAGGAVEVLATLLHEAAHGLATARGITDTSNRGHYHNREYKRLAEELGLEVADPASTGGRGFHDTTVPPRTRTDYADTLTSLAEALTVYRRPEAEAAPARTAGARSRNRISAVCACEDDPVRAWVARGTLARRQLACLRCGQPLQPENAEDRDLYRAD